MQWRSDLIGYDALSSYGSPSYYAQQMFSTHHGDAVLATEAQDIPTRAWQPPPQHRNGVEQPQRPAQEVPTLFFDATRNSKDGTIYLKIVNALGTPQPVRVRISGVSRVANKGRVVEMKARGPEDTNSLQEPRKIIPMTEKASGLSTNFTRSFPPCSITILELSVNV